MILYSTKKKILINLKTDMRKSYKIGVMAYKVYIMLKSIKKNIEVTNMRIKHTFT